VVRIAICDDHPVFRAGVASIINDQSDCQVVLQAGSVRELREGLATQAADLVLLDIELPGETGLDALDDLARTYRVLMLSAFDDARRIKQAMQKGAVGFVRKDSDPRELLRSIQRAARGETVLDVDLAVRVAQSLRAEPDEIEFKRRVGALSARQREVLALVGQGKSNKEIGQVLHLSEGTARNHVARMLAELEVPDRVKLALLLHRYGIAL
jgi:DNA-binding NarL/FixJ family response regulator